MSTSPVQVYFAVDGKWAIYGGGLPVDPLVPAINQRIRRLVYPVPRPRPRRQHFRVYFNGRRIDHMITDIRWSNE